MVRSLQDAHNCCHDFDPENKTALFAVYDGHGGKRHLLSFGPIFEGTCSLLQLYILFCLVLDLVAIHGACVKCYL